MNRVSGYIAHASRSTTTDLAPPDWLSPDWPPSDQSPPSTPPIMIDHGLEVYLPTRWITASNCIYDFTRSRPPSASPNSHNHRQQVHLRVHSVSVSKCISKHAWSCPPSTSLRSDGGCTEIQGGVTEVDSITGSIYSADSRVDRRHLFSISSYHAMKIHTLSFPTFGLTHSVRDFVDSHNCVDPQHSVVSYLLTRFIRFSIGISTCSSDYGWLQSAARLTVCLYIKRVK